MVELGLRSERPGSRKYKSGGARARVDGNTCGLWRAWQFPFSIPCGTPKTCKPGWQGKRRWIASSRLGLARWPARRSKERLIVALGKLMRSSGWLRMIETDRHNHLGRGGGRLLTSICSSPFGVVNQLRPIHFPVQFHPLDPASELGQGMLRCIRARTNGS